MKNTPIPLDMIFISRELKIVGIVEQTMPFSLDPRSVGAPSQYVLEINGGLAKRHGIQAGDSVRFDGIPTSSVAGIKKGPAARGSGSLADDSRWLLDFAEEIRPHRRELLFVRIRIHEPQRRGDAAQ